MKSMIRKVVNGLGYDIRRTHRGKPRWDSNIVGYYDVDIRPRYGHGAPTNTLVAGYLEDRVDAFEQVLRDMQGTVPLFDEIPQDLWNNNWFSTLDAASLMHFLLQRKPARYLEVGSGFSTKFARRAIEHGSLPTHVLSIDPQPRDEIDDLCDDLVRAPLEAADLSVYDTLEAGDIAFFDGSHRVLTNSDTTAFFLDVMPRLKPGVLIHIHDIFWPDDYAPEWNQRLYSEQYVLGAMMLAGMTEFRVILPNYFVSLHEKTAPLVDQLGIPTRYPGEETKPGLSFWLEKT